MLIYFRERAAIKILLLYVNVYRHGYGLAVLRVVLRCSIYN